MPDEVLKWMAFSGEDDHVIVQKLSQMNRIDQAHRLEWSYLGLLRDAALCTQVRKGRVEKRVVSLELLSLSH